MRKIFLIPMLALFTCVMARGTTVQVGTFEQLKAAIDGASNGDVIELTADIDYGTAGGTNYLNITKSITLDGQGHTLTGACKRAAADFWATLYVNDKAEDVEMMDIVIKDITLVNNKQTSAYGASIRFQHNINTAILTNVVMDITGGVRGNSAPMFLGGSDTNNPTYTLNNCKLLGKDSDYPYYSWIKAHIIAEDTYFSGYCGMYFKEGSFGTIVDATACQFDAPNVHSGLSNAFSVFAFEDGGIKMTLTNCGMNAEQIGDQSQRLLDIRYSIPLASRNVDVVDFILDGDNSHFNASWSNQFNNPVLNQIIFTPSGTPYVAENMPKVKMTIKGGTYSFDPSSIGWYDSWVLENEEVTGNVNIATATIPENYEVQEVKQGGVTLYRVVKKAATKTVEDPENPGSTIEVLYDLNDKVEGEGIANGDNPVSSFDLATGDTMQLNQETTTAGYVQVSDNITYNTETGKNDTTATTIQVGKVENEGTAQEEKVDQTLVINNGLDIQGDSKVEVQAGSALVIGEGGINTEKPENIVIEADSTGSASLLLHPAITVNQTPELTVKMTAKQVGKFGSDYFWHRFAMPVDTIESLPRTPNVPTKIFGWDYVNDDWSAISSIAELKPFYGYTLSVVADRQDVTYTFQGHLVGNLNTALNFSGEGYNFFGNSYTGYIDIVALADQLLDHADIDGAVWVWNTDKQNYQVVTLAALRDYPSLYEKWQKEIAPMQTFILRIATPGVSSASTVVDYKSAIWGNPRYGNNPSGAPARKNALEGNAIRMSVAANGMKDEVLFIEKANFSDDFDKGYDGTKYMNTEDINIYSTVNNENYSAVATDQIEGKMLTIETVNEVNYTISFDVVMGETEYALLDNATNKVIAIEEGASYEFAAQPNSTVEGRFEIVDRANVVTSIDNAEENKANVKGIYTIMGQYVGENFDVLPTGVYVVDGVKIVK